MRWLGGYAVEQALITFDYADLDSETRIVVQQKTGEIRERMRRAAQDIIEIGERLIDIQQRLVHGEWEAWLHAEFTWSDQTARRYIHVARAFSGKQQIVAFAPSALYLLAAPSTPDEARDEALARAESGETITYQSARQVVEQHRPVAKNESAITPPTPTIPDLTPFGFSIRELADGRFAIRAGVEVVRHEAAVAECPEQIVEAPQRFGIFEQDHDFLSGEVRLFGHAAGESQAHVGAGFIADIEIDSGRHRG